MNAIEAGYNKYYEFRNGKTFDDKPMSKWEELPPEIQKAWAAFLDGALLQITLGLNLDKREMLQLRHAKEYRNDFSEAGIPGHNQFLLLAKLATALRIE